jgi:hypothetical protein
MLPPSPEEPPLEFETAAPAAPPVAGGLPPPSPPPPAVEAPHPSAAANITKPKSIERLNDLMTVVLTMGHGDPFFWAARTLRSIGEAPTCVSPSDLRPRDRVSRWAFQVDARNRR